MKILNFGIWNLKFVKPFSKWTSERKIFFRARLLNHMWYQNMTIVWICAKGKYLANGFHTILHKGYAYCFIHVLNWMKISRITFLEKWTAQTQQVTIKISNSSLFVFKNWKKPTENRLIRTHIWCKQDLRSFE